MKIRKATLIILILMILMFSFSGCGGMIPSFPDPSKYYNILHKHSQKLVHCSGIHDGANIDIWGPITAGEEEYFEFKLVDTGDGYYYILNKSGKYVCSGDTFDGGNIHIWGPIPSGHEDRYKFKLISVQ